ncbi:MAG TPA: glycosyltransferase family 87 protein [Vicinamibacterales bacterium]
MPPSTTLGTGPSTRLGSRRAVVIAAAIALVAGLGVVFVRNFTDFSVYYTAGRSLLSGRTDLYAPDFARGVVMDYRYLPVFILTFAPLSSAPYPIAAWVWHLLDTGAIALAVASIASVCGELSYSRVKVWTVAFLIVVPYFAMALDYGNVHLIVTALMFAGLALALGGRNLSAATLLAIAITIKIIPALTLPYFAITRRFKLLGLVAIITVIVNLLPSIYFGVGGNRSLITAWFAHVIVGQEFHETNGPINLSLKGQLRRTFTNVDYSQRVDGDFRYPAVNVAALSPSSVDRVWMALSAFMFAGGLVLIGILARARTRVSVVPDLSPSNLRSTAERPSIDVRLEMLQIGLLICLMLFVGPLTSKVYLVALLWPVVAIGVAAWEQNAIRRALIGVAIVSSILPLLPGRTIQRLLLVAGTDFYVSTAILALVVFALFRSTRLHRS